MALLFTSDLHLGHPSILSYRTAFKDIDEHDQFIIKKWNAKVRPKDDVFILGDVSYRSTYHISYYLSKMRGKKHLIIGNHDHYWMKRVDDISEYFETVNHLKMIKFEKKQITLCHYPMLEWPGSRYAESKSSYLIHGHIHNRTETDTYEYIRKHLPHALNAGVDINNYEPVTFGELVKNNEAFRNRRYNEIIERAIDLYFPDGLK